MHKPLPLPRRGSPLAINCTSPCPCPLPRRGYKSSCKAMLCTCPLCGNLRWKGTNLRFVRDAKRLQSLALYLHVTRRFVRNGLWPTQSSDCNSSFTGSPKVFAYKCTCCTPHTNLRFVTEGEQSFALQSQRRSNLLAKLCFALVTEGEQSFALQSHAPFFTEGIQIFDL